MTGRGGRRFHLFDSMVLIAASALGFVAARTYLGMSDGLSGATVGAWINALHTGGVPFALVWSIALVLIRVQAPRHERRRLCTEPGFAAALAVVTCAAVVLLDSGGRTLFVRAKTGAGGPWNAARFAMANIRMLMIAAPSGVAATWAVLAVGGRWRPERSWLDRLGLVLGVYWITWPEVAWPLALNGFS
jgi:hypothetical protein